MALWDYMHLPCNGRYLPCGNFVLIWHIYHYVAISHCHLADFVYHSFIWQSQVVTCHTVVFIWKQHLLQHFHNESNSYHYLFFALLYKCLLPFGYCRYSFGKCWCQYLAIYCDMAGAIYVYYVNFILVVILQSWMKEVALSSFYVVCPYFTVTHWITLREIRTRQEPTSCRPLCI